MLGIVFTEFLGQVKNTCSPGMLDHIIEESGVDGDFAELGHYPHQDMAALVLALSQRTGEPAATILERFGKHLFGQLCRRHSWLVACVTDSLDFLQGVEQTIHAEMRKLYPQAELPRIDSDRLSPDTLRLTYGSRRCLAPLALGMIRGCAEYFGESLHVEIDGRLSAASVTFIIRRHATPLVPRR